MKKPPREIRIGDTSYRLAAKRRKADHYDDRFFRGDGVLFYVYALLTSKTGKNLPGVDEGVTKLRSSVPKELKADLTSEQMVTAKEAAKAGILWYCRLDGKGWRWRARDGAKDVPVLQRCLEFLQQFKSRRTVNGVQCIHCEINNRTVG